MSDPTSASGGCLRPIPSLGLDESSPEVDGLDVGLLDGPVVLIGSADGKVPAQRMGRFLHDWIVCLTGLDGALVRPRWQPEAPNLPAAGTDWCAFGFTPARSDTFPAVVHYDSPEGEEDDEGGGFDELQNHEEFDLLCSFYGPRADSYARAVRDNSKIAQNRAVLATASMGLIETGELTTLPSVVQSKWKFRVDITVRLRWLVAKQYRVQNILSAEVDLRVEADDGTTIDEVIEVTN